MRWLALAVLVAGCSSEAPRWHVAGGFLRAPDGRAAILRGVNLSGAQKQSPYLDVAGADDYQRLHDDWGLNAIRFVMTWAAVEPSEGNYDDAYLDQVAERLTWAEAAGLHVVLDMHEDVYGEGFGFDGAPGWTCDAARYAAFVPRDPWFLDSLDDNVVACVDHFWQSDDLKSRFVAAWAHVAARLQASPSVVGFDVLNEPAWGSYSIFDFEADLLAPLYARVVAAVRAHAPDWVAFLEPSASRNTGIATGLPKPGYRDVVYAPHSYDSAAEGSGSFDPSRAAAIADLGQKLAAEASALGAALWIGEYGGIPDGSGYADYMGAEYAAQGAASASAMYWDYGRGGGYSLLDGSGAPKPPALAAIARPYPEFVDGDPVSYAFDGASFQFHFVQKGSLPATIRVPPTITNYSVTCGGCSVEVGPGGATLRNLPRGAVTVEIH